MRTPEKLQPGDNVVVEACEKNKPFCVVSPAIDKREDNSIPINRSDCGCIRNPKKVKKIPHTLE